MSSEPNLESHSLGYRPDIDGLRAVAVISVLIYHSGLGLVPGGYVGVDIFFAISGYLITAIILADAHEGKFTIHSFYERRIKRIFPALFGMSAITSIVAWFLFMPLDFKEFGESLLAMSLFCSNIYFDLKTNYFTQEASVRPLLHTWSLAVEEQFYVAFPTLVALSIRYFKRGLRPIMLALFFVSLAAAIYEVHKNPPHAFYLIWFRAWELLAGSLLAIGLPGASPNKLLREVVAWSGALSIAIALFFYSTSTVFPGASAALPVLGGAAIIWSGLSGGKMTRVSSFLASRPTVYIGRISYSLYLYHWPVFVFSHYIMMRQPNTFEAIGLIALSLLLAAASYHFVEQPFRKRRNIKSLALFGSAFACMIACITIGWVAHKTNGLPSRLPPSVAASAMTAFDYNRMPQRCDSISPAQINANAVCSIGDSKAPITFVVMGDSFGDAMVPGVDAAARDAGKHGYVLTHAGCYPLDGVLQLDIGSTHGPSQNSACKDFMAASIAFTERHPEVNTVILIARWSSAITGTRFGLNKMDGMFVVDNESTKPGYDENAHVVKRGLQRLNAKIHPKRMVIGAYIPEQTVNIPRSIAMQEYLTGSVKDPGVSREVYEQRQKPVHMLLEKLVASSANIQVADIGARMCNAIQCPAAKGNTPLYVDDNHVTQTEAIKLSDVFTSAFLP